MTVKTMELKPAPDCKKCGGQLMADGDVLYTVQCAYPEDCPVKQVHSKKSEFKRISTILRSLEKPV